MRKRLQTTILSLVTSLLCAGQFQHRVDSLEAYLKFETEHTAIANILNELSVLHIDTLPATALSYANRALTISNNVGYLEGRIAGYRNIGEVYRNTGNYEEAVEAFTQMRMLYEASEDYSGAAHAYLLLGATYAESGFRSKAMEYLNQAVQEGDKGNDEQVIGLAYTELAILHYDQGNTLAAQEFLNEALRSFELANDDVSAAVCNKYLGLIFRDLEDYERALQYFARAAEVYERNPIEPHHAEVNLNLGYLFYNMSNDKQALQLLEQSLPVIEATGSKANLVLAYETLNEAYQEMGEYQRAYEYFRLYSSIKDAEEITELQTRLDAENKALEIEKLKEQQERIEAESLLKDAEISRRNTVVIATVFGLVVVVALLLFILRAYQKNKRATIALEKAKLQAEASQEARERFLAYVSHEIRTPLNAIVGMSQLLERDDLSTKQSKRLTTIRSSANNVLMIVNDILDMSKIESGMMDVEHIDFLFDEVVQNVAQIIRAKAESKHLALLVDIDPNIPPVLIGDPIRLTQILLNLADNALKFTRKGHISLTIKLATQNNNEVDLHFEITDTGIGIPMNKLDSIFNPFKQESSSVTREYGGSGLGLNIVKRLIEIQGGKITVESQLNKGTTFSFDLKYEAGHQSAIAIDEAHYNSELLANKKVLVVDDNKLNQEVLTDLLLELNEAVTVHTTDNGKSATERVAEEDYDLVLMDIQMPRMNGYEATMFIRENLTGSRAQVPIVAMTAHALSGVADRCFEAGMNDYISKPIKINDLLNTIGRVWKDTAQQISTDNEFKVINLEPLRALTNDSNDKLVKYIDIFLNNVPTDIDRLEEFADKEEFDEFAKVAHKMKSNISYMGITELEQVLTDIQAYKDDDSIKASQALQTVNDIRKVCNNAIAELNEVKTKLIA